MAWGSRVSVTGPTFANVSTLVAVVFRQRLVSFDLWERQHDVGDREQLQDVSRLRSLDVDASAKELLGVDAGVAQSLGERCRGRRRPASLAESG